MLIVKLLSFIFLLAFTFFYCFEAYERLINDKVSFYYVDILFCVIVVVNLYFRQIVIILLSLLSSLGFLLYFVLTETKQVQGMSSYYHQVLLNDYIRMTSLNMTDMNNFKESSLRLYSVYKFVILNIAKLITSAVVFILFLISFAKQEYLLDQERKWKIKQKHDEDNDKKEASKLKKE